jgi:uncharacterized protein (DUF427 family)
MIAAMQPATSNPPSQRSRSFHVSRMVQRYLSASGADLDAARLVAAGALEHHRASDDEGGPEMPKRESLYSKYPDYRVDLEAGSERFVARLGAEVVADSEAVLIVRETNLDPVVYFPRNDVHMELLERTDNETFCPFKGEASYWTVRTGEREEQDAVWSYEDPFDQVAGLKDYVSFFTDRLEVGPES